MKRSPRQARKNKVARYGVMLFSAALAATPALAGGCSTFRSHYYMRARATPGVTLKGSGRTSEAVINGAGFTIYLSVPYAGTLQHSTGPCLLPVFPNSREWPRPLRMELAIVTANPEAKVAMDPATWQLRTRDEEFGKTFGGKDTFADVAPHRVVFHAGQRPWSTDTKVVAHWSMADAQGKADKIAAEARPMSFTGSAWAFVDFALYSNQFVDFHLTAGSIEVDGKTFALPHIEFRRHSEWDYTPYTTKVLDM